VLAQGQDAAERSLVAAGWKMSVPALAGGGSHAYRARMRPVDDAETVLLWPEEAR
jgi:hypothetical protein